MTDNEKRAHDLAIAMVSYTMNPETLKGIADAKGESEVHVDPYGIYLDYYKMFLEAFNRDYPGSGKSLC